MTQPLLKESKKWKFECPECNSNQIAEHLTNYQSIWVIEDGDVQIGNESLNSEKVHFFCWECGQPVLDDHGFRIENHDDLVRRLQGDILESTKGFSRQIENGQPIIQEATAGPESDCLQFTCPECGGNRLDEVTYTVTLFEFNENGTMEYGQSYYDQDEEHFQCGGCGWVLHDEAGNRIVTYDALLAWLKEDSD